jgi:hypothetical protein
MTNLLDELATEEFIRAVGVLGVPPPAMRLVLQRSPYVIRLAERFRTGTVTEENILSFVSQRQGELRRGTPFAYDLALAGIAAALEGSSSLFAGEFIADLAGLNLIEMQQSIQVARECMKHRRASPCTVQKRIEIASDVPTAVPQVVVERVDVGRRFLPPNTFGGMRTPSNADAAA